MGLHKLLRERGPKILSVVKTNSSALGSTIWGAPYFIWLLFFFLARVTCSEYQPSQSAVEAIMAIFQRASRLGQFCKLQEINSSFITHLAFQVDACCCCCSIDHPCPNLHDPMDCSTPGLPVPHRLLEFAQVHVHCISDAIQPSQLLMPSSPSAFNLSQHQGIFQ